MVRRRRGRDWIYKAVAAAGIAQQIAIHDVAIFDLVEADDVKEMTTATVLRVLLRFSWFTDVNWSTGSVQWYCCVMPASPSDPAESLYNAAINPNLHGQISDSFTVDHAMWEQRDPMMTESQILLANNTVYGEPSDHPAFLRADMRTKRTLNDGDRLVLVVEADGIIPTGGEFGVFVDSAVLVRAA